MEMIPFGLGETIGDVIRALSFKTMDKDLGLTYR
jgi:hypothetical protein